MHSSLCSSLLDTCKNDYNPRTIVLTLFFLCSLRVIINSLCVIQLNQTYLMICALLRFCDSKVPSMIMMKVSGFCALFLMAVAAFALFNFTTPTDLVATNYGHRTTTLILGSRKLKENESNDTNKNMGDVTLEDYNNGSVPNSETYVKAAPVEHGTPLMPYIPKPSPPGTGREITTK